MSDNYPPGAANDPFAPYNEPIDTETYARVTATMVKEYCLTNVHRHVCTEYEIDPDTGKRVPYHFTEADDLEKCFNDQENKLHITLECCRKLCKQLLEDGHRFYAHINIQNLMEECDDWEMEEFNIEEI